MDLQLQITGRGMTLTEAMKNKVYEKLAAPIAPLYDDSATTVQVDLVSESRQQKDDHFECRVNVCIPHQKDLFVHETSDDLYVAIDLVQDRLLELVKERKDRRRNHHQAQKQAEHDRGIVARDSMTTLGEGLEEPEQWEKETAAFEKAQDRGLN